jgi:hypothetical protein
MQCRQCGAATRPGMAQCPNCGAQLTKQDNASNDSYQPQQSYIPGGGGGAGYASGGAGGGYAGGDIPAEPSTPEGGSDGSGGQRRPLGSLGRRLQQRSGASVPDGAPDMDEVYPPQRTPRSRPPRDDYQPRGGYGAPDDRGRRPSRPSTGSRRRGRSYDEDYSRSDDRASYDYDDGPPDEAPGWGDERGSRARSRGERGAGPDGESEEMVARRGGSRSKPPRRRGGPDHSMIHARRQGCVDRAGAVPHASRGRLAPRVAGGHPTIRTMMRARGVAREATDHLSIPMRGR